jgi:hypothetical protein
MRGRCHKTVEQSWTEFARLLCTLRATIPETALWLY